MTPAELQLVAAKVEAERAKQRLASTAAALQQRLKPAHLMSEAKDGVRRKSSEMAEDAIQAIKDRPAKVSGVAAGIALFLARDAIWNAVSSVLKRNPETGAAVAAAEPKDDADRPKRPARRRKQGASA